MSFTIGSITIETSSRSGFPVSSAPFVSFPPEIRPGSTLDREFTLLTPFTLEWYQLVIEKLADAVHRHLHLEDYLAQNIVEWASKVFKLDLDSVESRSQGIELINELSNSILINPLTLEPEKVPEPLVNPMTDGVWWWEKGSKDQLWTLEHYKTVCLVEPPISPFDMNPLRVHSHPLAAEIIAIRNAVMPSVRAATFSRFPVASGREPLSEDSKVERKAPSSVETPIATTGPLVDVTSQKIALSIRYMQKAQTVRHRQTEHEKQRLYKLEGHKIAVMRLEMQRKLREEVERLQKIVTDNQEQLEIRIRGLEEGNREKVSELQKKIDKIQKELSTANTKLAEVSAKCTAQAFAIGAMEENYKQKLQEIERLKTNAGSSWGQGKVAHKGGFCVIL